LPLAPPIAVVQSPEHPLPTVTATPMAVKFWIVPALPTEATAPAAASLSVKEIEVY